jgi:hypothetical protein
MKRSNRVKTYLSYAYNIVGESEDRTVFDLFYEFLTDNRTDKDVISEEMISKYDIDLEDIVNHKDDMILEIIKGFYLYMNFCMALDEINNEEKKLIDYLEKENFDYERVVLYFRNPQNLAEAKLMIEDYCMYRTQSDEYRRKVEEYNEHNKTPFLEEINMEIRYADVIDEIADVYQEVFAKTTDELDFEADEEEYTGEGEDEYTDEELDEKIEETVTKACEILIENFRETNSPEMNEFLGYYLSLMYAIFCERKEMKVLLAEDIEIMNILEEENYSLEDILQYFYNDPYKLFAAIESVSDEYNISEGLYYDFRYCYDSKEIFNKLDPRYTYASQKDSLKHEEKYSFSEEPIIIIGSLVETMDMIIAGIKMRNPKDYKEKLYEFLVVSSDNDGILYEFDIEDKFTPQIKFCMMRMLARKFYEYNYSRDRNFETDYAYEQLMFLQLKANSIIENFHEFGLGYIETYFKMENMSDLAEKELIRRLDMDTRRDLVRLDPSVIADSLYYKSLMVGRLYILLEENGVEAVINALEYQYDINPDRCIEFISELLIELYHKLKNSENKIDIDEMFLKYLEGNSWSLSNYVDDLMKAKQFLKELLKRYLELQKKIEYPRLTTDIINDKVFDEKIKIKVLPNGNK